METEEIWKDIPGWEGLYQVSNLGRVKSLPRNVTYKDGRVYYVEGCIRKQYSGKDEYKFVILSNAGYKRRYGIHQLVGMAFLDYKPNGTKMVIDHINNDSSDNRLENLQIVSQRINTFKDKHGTSKYIGVYWNKSRNKWRAMIHINGKKTHIGYFDEEEEAAKAYQDALQSVEV